MHVFFHGRLHIVLVQLVYLIVVIFIVNSASVMWELSSVLVHVTVTLY